MEKLINLFEDDFIRISYFLNNSDTVILSFSSTPRIPSGQEIAEEQFIGTISKNGHSGIFIIDKTSSYGNKIDFAQIYSMIAPIVLGKTVHAVGYCMGGFLAIAMSKYLTIDKVIAVTPQWSIHPDFLLKDSYLLRFSNEIKDWKIKDLSDSFNESTDYYILSSHEDNDLHSISFFPKSLSNLRIFDFGPEFGHDLPEAIHGNLEALMMSCINGNPDAVDKFIQDYYKELDRSILYI